MVRSPRPPLMIACLFTSVAATVALGAEPPAAKGPVRAAIEGGSYPWYDAGTDTFKPVWPPKEWYPKDSRIGKGTSPGYDLSATGNLVAIGLAMLGLAILLVVLMELWRRYRPRDDDRRDEGAGPGTSPRIEGLPAGIRPGTLDPWAEAALCRARGDLGRAVVCLFAHQLLTLDRLRQIRLVPGRTGRQLVGTVSDREFRGWVEPTLRLFEAAYYGHRGPSAEAFEPVWAAAEAFQRRVAAEGPS